MPSPPKWSLDGAVLRLSGAWIAQSGAVPVLPESALQGVPRGALLAVDMTAVTAWDSGLIGFLWDAKRQGVALAGLPDTAGRLLDLLPSGSTKPAMQTRAAAVGLFGRIGAGTIHLLSACGALASLVATAAHGAVAALRGKAQMRGADLAGDTRAAGPQALVIVSIVNFLIGAILAFVGAVQLRKFAAGLYVANLVGLALVREMSAVMTAIVMAGRTGGAYAARIATMQGNEEIDALRVTGISVADYIILPSILSLVFTLPFLYLYGCLVGMLGGLVVATAMLDMSVASYLHQTFGAVALDQFVFGFVKSVAFAFLIGATSCRIGLAAGRSSADVGSAATKAVVVGIVGVIALDAIFAVIADRIGL